MPFLRVLRDKRGYETTYLMHWFRDGNRQRSRILYLFRTPPGVKVGRDPIDPSIIREIESLHPEIEFDWRALRENQQIVDIAPEPRRQRPSRGPGRSEPAEGRKGRREEREKPAAEKPPTERPKVEARPPRTDAGTETQPPQPFDSAQGRPRLNIPAGIEGATREDQLVFLLNWYLNLRERVPHRTQDPIRREALRALVERLNPEVWAGEEAIVAGLQDAAEALQRLSTLFSRRRKRSRRARAAEGAAADAGAAEQTGSEGGATADVAETDQDPESERDLSE